MGAIAKVIASLLSELRRRKVTQIVLAYGAFAWLLLQIGAIVFETFDMPDWSMRLLFLVLLLGLPAAVILTWIFDFSPHGIERTATLAQLSARKTGLPAVLVARISGTESGTDLSPGQANLLLRESALWALDFNSAATQVHDTELEVAFKDASDALVYSVRVQDHAQLLKIALHIGISAHPDIDAGSPLHNRFTAPANALTDLADAGSIAVDHVIHTALKRTRDKLLGRALQPLRVDSSAHKDPIWCIERTLINELDDNLKMRVAVAGTREPSTLIKALSLIFLTALVGLVWNWLPTVQRSTIAEPPTLAVLPFTGTGDHRDFSLLIDGLSDDLFNAIARIEKIRIAARRSSRTFRGSEKSVQEIGELLNANLLLEGEIRPVEGRLKVTAWLTETDTGLERWNRSFEQPSGRLDRIRKELTRQLADELGLKVSPGLFAGQQVVSQSHPDVYPMYLEALGYLNLPKTSESLQNAQDLYEQVIDIAPDYLAARAGLCTTHLSWYENFKDIEHFETAQAYCLEALDAEKENVDLLLALGTLYQIQGDNEQAQNFFDRGLALNATNVELQKGQAKSLVAQDRKDKAEEVLKQALLVDPAYASLYIDLGTLYLGMGRWDEAIEMYTEATRLQPGNYGVHTDLGSAYFYAGRFAEAAVAYEKSLELEPNRTALSNTATMHYYSGDFERAAELYVQATELAPRDYRLWANLADAESQISGLGDVARGHYQFAQNMLTENLEVNPNDPELLAMAAWCAVNTGESDLAELRITEAILQASDNPIILYTAAQVHSLLDQDEIAANFVRRSLENGFPANVMAATPRLGQLMESD